MQTIRRCLAAEPIDQRTRSALGRACGIRSEGCLSSTELASFHEKSRNSIERRETRDAVRYVLCKSLGFFFGKGRDVLHAIDSMPRLIFFGIWCVRVFGKVRTESELIKFAAFGLVRLLRCFVSLFILPNRARTHLHRHRAIINE